MGKLMFLVGFATLAACGAGDDSSAESDASHGNWTVFAGSHAAEYVAGTGVSEAGRAAPEPVVDAGTPDAGQPVEVDAGHAAGGGGGSAGHVAEVAGSGEAGREAVAAGSGGSAGSAPVVPTETVLWTWSTSCTTHVPGVSPPVPVADARMALMIAAAGGDGQCLPSTLGAAGVNSWPPPESGTTQSFSDKASLDWIQCVASKIMPATAPNSMAVLYDSTKQRDNCGASSIPSFATLAGKHVTKMVRTQTYSCSIQGNPNFSYCMFSGSWTAMGW